MPNLTGSGPYIKNVNQFTIWLSYILLCNASNSTSEGHKLTYMYELVISLL